MRYHLCTSGSQEKIGDIILDNAPKKGDRIRFNEADWRVMDIVWEQDANHATNSVPSGLLCLEPINAPGSRGDMNTKDNERSKPRDLSGCDVTKLADELRAESVRLNNESARETALDKPYHLFFFTATDCDGVTRFFDIMEQEDGFSLAETAKVAPRLGPCIETVYPNPVGGMHHAHRNYGQFRTQTAVQAMEEFARLTALAQVRQLAETLTAREASPTWRFIFEQLGCESVDLSEKDAQTENPPRKAGPPHSMIDFTEMTPIPPDAELADGLVRIIMPNGKCFDILEELWTKAQEIEPGCVIVSRKATGSKQN